MTSRSIRTFTAVTVALLAAASPCADAGAQPIPAGGAFQVHTYATGRQQSPAVAMLPDDGFVIVWRYRPSGLDFSEARVAARLFDDEGAPIGPQFDVASATEPYQVSTPDVSAADDGSFVVAWSESVVPAAGDSFEVLAQRYDATGTTIGTQFRVNTYTTGQQAVPSIGHDAAGGFVVSWAGQAAQDGDGHGVFAQRFDAAAAALGTEFQVNTYTTDSQGASTISVDGDGSFVIAWTSFGGFSVWDSVHAQRFSAAGAPVGPEIAVSEPHNRDQDSPDVDHESTGGFVVVWSREGDPTALGRTIEARRYDAAGVPAGPPFTVAAPSFVSGSSADSANDPALHVNTDGSFVFAYRDDRGPLDRDVNVYLQEVAANDTLVDPLMIATDFLPLESLAPAIAGNDEGSFVVAFSEYSFSSALTHDGTDETVRARRFCAAGDAGCDHCAGFDDAVDDDGDGVPNGCDPCTNVGGAQDAGRTKVLVKRNGAGFSKKNKISLKSRFSLPGPDVFAMLDPAARGARVRVESAAGVAVFDRVIEPGLYAGTGTAGWELRAGGANWTYRNSTDDPTNDVVKLELRDFSSHGPNLLSMKLSTKAGSYDADEKHLPLRAFIAAGDESDASAGYCGEAAFALDGCKAKLKDGVSKRRMSCRLKGP